LQAWLCDRLNAASVTPHAPSVVVFVMAGLVPAIHVLFAGSINKENVDARHKAGHDGVLYQRPELR
jgi:uncharacterized membrane protein (DUF485 family)